MLSRRKAVEEIHSAVDEQARTMMTDLLALTEEIGVERLRRARNDFETVIHNAESRLLELKSASIIARLDQPAVEALLDILKDTTLTLRFHGHLRNHATRLALNK